MLVGSFDNSNSMPPHPTQGIYPMTSTELCKSNSILFHILPTHLSSGHSPSHRACSLLRYLIIEPAIVKLRHTLPAVDERYKGRCWTSYGEKEGKVDMDNGDFHGGFRTGSVRERENTAVIREKSYCRNRNYDPGWFLGFSHDHIR